MWYIPSWIKLLNSRKSPWADLDREESATTQERLGIANAGSTLWYGGTTQFSMKLVATDGNRQALKYEVLPAEKSTSDRNRRQYGSKAFIRISVKGRMTDEVADFLKRPIVLLGRVCSQHSSSLTYANCRSRYIARLEERMTTYSSSRRPKSTATAK